MMNFTLKIIMIQFCSLKSPETKTNPIILNSSSAKSLLNTLSFKKKKAASRSGAENVQNETGKSYSGKQDSTAMKFF